MGSAAANTELDLNMILAPGGYAMRVIKYRAKWLMREKGVVDQEQSDLEQELAIRLIQRLKNYDPTRSKLTTFVATAIRFAAHDISRERFGDKHVAQRATRSLDVGIGKQFGRRRTLGDMMTRSDQVRGRGRTDQDDQLEVDLQEDFQSVIAGLPPRLQKICERMLAARSPYDAQKNVSTADLATIRGQFEQAGLRDYI